MKRPTRLTDQQTNIVSYYERSLTCNKQTNKKHIQGTELVFRR